jgi:GT2 family glycosyltransferase
MRPHGLDRLAAPWSKAPMSAAEAAQRPLAKFLVRLVFGIRAAVLDRPAIRATLRTIGWPVIKLMHAVTRVQPVALPPEALPAPTPDMLTEPVLKLPLHYTPGPLTPAPRIAVLLHAFYVDVLPEMASYLKRIPFPADLFISTDDEAKRKKIAAAFAGWPLGKVEIRVAPNRGRNFGPQLITFRDVYDSHPYVLFLHTKKSVHTDELAGWREQTLRQLLGSTPMIRGVFEAFTRLPELGVIAPRIFRPVRQHMIWPPNFGACRVLAERMGFALYPDSPLDFPAGAMFWARSAALKPILDLELTFEDFDPEGGQKDGTLAHAVERLIFHSAELAGFRWLRAGDDVDVRAPEALIGVEEPRLLQRMVTDCGRSLLIRGRRPRPLRFTINEPRAGGDLKGDFRALCRTELDGFLAGGERLTLPTSDAPEVSILLVLFNQAELTFQCLRSLQFALDRPSEIIIADNASSDRTHALLDRIDGARIIRNAENLHFLRGVNGAAADARGKYLLLLNNDTRVTPGAIAAAVERLETEADLGAVGGPIELLDGTLQEAGSVIWADGTCRGNGREGDPMQSDFQFRRDVDYCSGAFLMMPRALFEDLGRFDEAFAPAYYEETDLCMRIWESGRRIAYEPRAHVTHFEFGSSSTSASALALQAAHHKVFVQRHKAELLATHHPAGSSMLQARMRGRFEGRVLIIEDQVPYPQLGAGYPRAMDIVEAADAAGWFVTLYPLIYGDVDWRAAYAPGVVPRGVEIAAECGAPLLVEFLRERAGYYDAVIVSRPQNMVTFREALAQAPEFISLDRVIYDAEAIVALRDQTLAQMSGRGADLEPAVEAEVKLAHGAGQVLAVNAQEAETFRKWGAGQVSVLGHGLAARPTAQPFEARRDLLFVGALDADREPNADSLIYFVREVMPILDDVMGPDYVLRIAGRCGAPKVRELAGPRVELLGRVEDLTPLYDRSRVFIAPTRYAAGIPMKVHDAAAAGLPVAATPLLAEQLGWSDGEALVVGGSPGQFARAVQRLYTDAALWERVRAGALARIETECSPEAFAGQVAAVLKAAKGS